jgi:hypothetical protein
MSRSSSISSTSGFVTPESSPEISTSALPSVDDDADISEATPIQSPRKDLFSPEVIARTIEAKDDSDSAETETDIIGDKTFTVEDATAKSTGDLFLERLTNSSRSSLHGSDHLAAELAEFGIYDSELLEEDEVLAESSSDDEEGWEEHEMQIRGDDEAHLNGNHDGKRRSKAAKKKIKWKEAEEELQRGGNRSLVEVRLETCGVHPGNAHPCFLFSWLRPSY